MPLRGPVQRVGRSVAARGGSTTARPAEGRPAMQHFHSAAGSAGKPESPLRSGRAATQESACTRDATTLPRPRLPRREGRTLKHTHAHTQILMQALFCACKRPPGPRARARATVGERAAHPLAALHRRPPPLEASHAAPVTPRHFQGPQQSPQVLERPRRDPAPRPGSRARTWRKKGVWLEKKWACQRQGISRSRKRREKLSGGNVRTALARGEP